MKSNEKFCSKSYQNDNLAKRLHTNNQQKSINCLKPRSNKNEHECKKCGCNYFYVFNFSFAVLSICVMYKNSGIIKIKSHPEVVDNFKELSFYNKPIKKTKVKRLKKTDQLAELPFYEQLSVIKRNQVFRGYATSYKVEIIEKKDPIVQLEASKPSIKNLFSSPLNETKGFKNQITVKVLLKKYKLNGEIGFAPTYFNSTAKV